MEAYKSLTFLSWTFHRFVCLRSAFFLPTSFLIWLVIWTELERSKEENFSSQLSKATDTINLLKNLIKKTFPSFWHYKVRIEKNSWGEFDFHSRPINQDFCLFFMHLFAITRIYQKSLKWNAWNSSNFEIFVSLENLSFIPSPLFLICSLSNFGLMLFLRNFCWI